MNSLVLKPRAVENCVVLHEVTWPTFMSLLSDVGDHRGSRFAYDKGELEIMSTCMLHETAKGLLNNFMFVLAEEFNQEYIACGSTLYAREDAQACFEPDGSFYIRESLNFGSNNIVDMRLDPPPDIVIQIDYSRTAMSILEICATLEIAEIWYFDGHEFKIQRLRGRVYEEVSESGWFSGLQLSEAIPEIIRANQLRNHLKAIREFRAWVYQNRRENRS